VVVENNWKCFAPFLLIICLKWLASEKEEEQI